EVSHDCVRRSAISCRQSTNHLGEGMTELSVTEALERISELNETTVNVFGKLSHDFEGCCISQIPRPPAQSDRDPEPASIWTHFDFNAIGHDEGWLRQFDSRHVRVTGTLKSPSAPYSGCGHLGMWPAEVTVTSIEK